MRQAAPSGADAIMEAICRRSGGSILATGPAHVVAPMRTEGGFDHGAFEVGGLTLRYLNEYMTVERGPERLATYPDAITTLSTKTGRPAAISEIREGEGLAVFHVAGERLPLSSSTTDRVALAEVEQIMGVKLIRERGGR